MKHFFVFLACLSAFLFSTVSADTHQEIKAVVFDFGGVVVNADRAPMVSFLRQSFQLDDELATRFYENGRCYRKRSP